MSKSISEIKKAITAFQNDTVQLHLKSIWDNDFTLYTLEKYKAGKNNYSYTSNAPRVLADKVQGFLEGAELLIRISNDKLTDEQVTIASNIERFLYGALDLNDVFLANIGQPSLRRTLAWNVTIRGGVLCRVYLKKNENGETIPEIRVWDAYNSSYGIGKDGIAWAAHTRTAPVDAIKEEYPDYNLPHIQTEATIVDWWDSTDNSIHTGSTWLKKPVPHGLKKCPVYLIVVGSMPSIISAVDNNANIHRWRTIFAANRKLYPIYNKTLSDLLTIVSRGTRPPIGYWSADGKKTLEKDIWQTEKGSAISLERDDKIAEIMKPTMPTDAAALVSLVSSETQRGGLPNTSYGELGFRLSGFAINQLQSTIETIIQPFAQTIETAYKLIGLSLLNQFAGNTGYSAVKVKGETSTGEVFGYPVPLEISPSDISKNWNPIFKLEPVLPKDDAQKYLIAREAKQIGIAQETIIEDVLKFRDTTQELNREHAEWGDNIPLIKLQKLMFSYVEKGRLDLAQIVITEMQRILQAQTAQQQQSELPQQGLGSLEQFSAESPGVGVPSGETGFPPQVLPAESVGTPAGVQNATGGQS